MRHVYDCQVRWADMDSLGHVNNVQYVDYLQEARIDFVRTLGYAITPGEGLIVVRTHVRYLDSLVYRPEPVRIECWVAEIRAATLTVGYEIFDEDADGGRRVYVQATTVLSIFDFERHAPRRLSAAEKQALAPYVEESPVPRAVVEESRRGAEHHYPVHVRFSDIDGYGHVNNVRFVEFLQEARISLISDLLGGLPGSEEGAHLVVGAFDLDYRRQLTPRATPYDAWTDLVHVGRTSMALVSQITVPETGEVAATGRFVLVFVDPATGRSTEPPTDLRERLVAFTPGC